MTDRDYLAEIFAGEQKAEEVFEELCRNKGLTAKSALWLHKERERLTSLAHDLYVKATDPLVGTPIARCTHGIRSDDQCGQCEREAAL